MGYGYYSMGYGQIQHSTLHFELTTRNRSILVRFSPADGFDGCYFGIYRNAKKMKIVKAEDVDPSEWIPIQADPFSSINSIAVICHGYLADQSASIPELVRLLEGDECNKATLIWVWQPEAIGTPLAGNYTSSWVIDGLPYDYSQRVNGYPTRGIVYYDLDIGSDEVTVTVYHEETILCSGTGTLGSTVALSEVGSTGVTGSVVVDVDAIDSVGVPLYIRWPKSMRVLRNTFNPPTTIEATIPFNQLNGIRWTETDDLANGTYYYRLQPVSDTGEPGQLVDDIETAVILNVPEPPTNIRYDSGDGSASDPVRIAWDASLTAGVTYSIYFANLDDTHINYCDPIVTGLTDLYYDLPAAVCASAPGAMHAVVKAVKDGVESRNGNTLHIEFDSDCVLTGDQPNNAYLDRATLQLTSGTEISVVGSYDNSFEEGVATKLRLFVRDPEGEYDFTDHVAEVSLTSSVINSVKRATLTHDFGVTGDGWYYIAAKAVTAIGVLSPSIGNELLVYISDDLIEGQEFDLHVSRG